MSTDTILLFAVGVFVLMAIGIFLTVIEFDRIKEHPVTRTGPDAGRENRPVSANDSASAPVRLAAENQKR